MKKSNLSVFDDEITNETHPLLSADELTEIAQFRVTLRHKNEKQMNKLIYEWAKTGVIKTRQHLLLCKYVHGGSNATE